MNQSTELIRRIVNALNDSTTGKEINPFEFFNHPELANWLVEANEYLNRS